MALALQPAGGGCSAARGVHRRATHTLAVWAFYCDTSHWEDWMPRAKCSDFSGPVDKVGTTYVETMRLMGFEMKSTSTVVEVEPLRLYHEHTDMGPMDTFMR